MTHHKAQSTPNVLSVTKQFNVTNLTPNQKRQLFIEYLTRAGFSGFIKMKKGKRTYYTFIHRN